MRMRRITSTVVAAAAVAGLSVAGVGIASAGERPSAPATAACNAPTDGSATNSPGLLSGNVVQVPVANCMGAPLVYAPVTVPANICGNSITVVGAQNPAYGNTCTNTVDDTRDAADSDAADYDESDW